ncbi:uncharacterized protein [Oryza sativa Japonica Group]|uniref:uncharacterized protein n=1 Tax=Oryza sativa subsp. japonica TaxID=39947 RepID=UPI000E1BFE3E|nr:uncharacterized protein LOC107281111 isoform X11 [Oryza sativa Japonica Group]
MLWWFVTRIQIYTNTCVNAVNNGISPRYSFDSIYLSYDGVIWRHRKIVAFVVRHPKIVYLLVDTVKSVEQRRDGGHSGAAAAAHRRGSPPTVTTHGGIPPNSVRLALQWRRWWWPPPLFLRLHGQLPPVEVTEWGTSMTARREKIGTLSLLLRLLVVLQPWNNLLF